MAGGLDDGGDMMTRTDSWPWDQSLGALRPDEERTYAITRILFGLVRDRCSDVGLSEGVTFRCRDRGWDQVTVQVASGDVKSLELAYAWFIQVEPVSSDRPAN